MADFSKDFVKALKGINANIGADGALPTDWISTGNYCLNKLFSGYLDKGIPVGRITTFAGPSGTGKSLLMASIMREAISKGYFVVLFDSEAAIDSTFLKNLGVDTDRVAYVEVDTMESYKNKQVAMLESITNEKVLFVLDSYGNLATEKELKDALEGKNASDMGLRAKLGRAIFRTVARMIQKKNAALLVANHTYTNASGYVPFDEMSAGKGLEYTSSIVTFLGKKKDKDGKEVTGLTITATTQKNRFCPPFGKVEMSLSFKKGLSKYSGLLDLLKDNGTIEQNGAWYTFGDTKFQRKDFGKILEQHWDTIKEFEVPSTFGDNEDEVEDIDVELSEDA